MNVLKSIFGATCLACTFVACQDESIEGSNSNSSLAKEPYEWHVPSYVELRASSKNLSVERYIGKGFNLMKYPRYDDRGFTKYPVLALAEPAWSPFGRAIEVEDIQVSLRQEPSPKIERLLFQDLSAVTQVDTMLLDLGADYQLHALSYINPDITRQADKSHTYSSFVFRKDKSVLLPIKENRNLEFYLDKGFVADLSKLPAEDLVYKYGTHVVKHYYVGPYMRLLLSAKASIFTKNELNKAQEKLWRGKLKFEEQLERKFSERYEDVAIQYRQAGSTYSPQEQLFSFARLSKSQTDSLDDKAWEDRLVDDHAFLMAPAKGLVPIPDLIADIPLKVKYISGVLMETRPSKQSVINYILCNPSSYEPFKLKGKYVRLALKSYGDAVGRLRLGLDASKVLQETDFTGVGVKEHEWTYELQTNGLWTIKSRVSGRYLCTDAQMREENEDTKDLRFWLLNPIVPTPNGNSRSISQLLIRRIQ